MSEYKLENSDQVMSTDQYQELMKELLDEKLYRHSLGVAQAAASLALQYGLNSNKAFFAGIIHDYGKRYSKQELLLKADQMKLRLDPVTRRERRLLHAPVGAALLKKELAVYDQEVLRAVYYHTTGRKGMTGLEKLIYLADYVEAGRAFKEAEKIRALAWKDLDRALLVAVEFAIKTVLERGLLLHPRSVVFRNSLLGIRRKDQ